MQVRVFLDSQTLLDTAIHSLDTSGINNPIAQCSNKEDLNHKFDDVHFMGGIYWSREWKFCIQIQPEIKNILICD
jgi:hypothetical protein